MPALPRLRIDALADLARQLRFAPPRTARRQMDRAAALVVGLDPALTYPEDWLIYKITGFRPELARPAMLIGAALLADLPALVERLSIVAALVEADLPAGRFLSLGALAARWGVTARTIERRRRGGLLAVRYRGRGGRVRLAFLLSSVVRYERLHDEGVRRGAAYSRIGPEMRARMLRRAVVYRGRFGCTLNGAATRIAARYGRGVQTVRALLQRGDAERPGPVEPGLLTPRERRFIDRADRAAQEPAAVARRLGRPLPTVRRAIRQLRVDRLRTIAPAAHAAPKAGQPSPARPILDGLGAPGPATLGALVQAARDAAPPAAAMERALALHYQFLRASAAAGIAALPARAPGATALDRIETDLRTAARIRAELVRSQLPLMLRTIGAVRPVEDLRAPLLLPLVESCLAALAEAADDFNPGARAGRLAAPAGLALTRAVSKWAVGHAPALSIAPGRAAARPGPDVPITDFTGRIAPWQAFLDPAPRVRSALPRIPERERRFLALRFGWSGPAHTLVQLAGLHGTTLIKVAQFERRALRAALRAGAGA
ncbi:MAG: hypothetical protein IT437_08215 [Phycisphaerales bacterium]|nr:hypothetical protein [Phycisphaerales bacterium]